MADDRAREGELASLHGVFAQFLANKLSSGEASAAELNCIRQFLKDNGIDCIGQANVDINSIVHNLPKFEDTNTDNDHILN